MSNVFKEIFKEGVFSALNLLPLQAQNQASILMYHSINDSGAFSSTPPAMLEAQLHFITNNGYTVLPLSELFKKLHNQEPLDSYVSLTFDDGYRDNLENALPILEKYQAPASIFIITNKLGQSFTNSQGFTFDLMTLKELEELNRSQLIELLPHTANHFELPTLSQEQAIEEIERSHEFLTSHFGTCSKILAYPRGKYTEELATYLETSGWQGAVTVNPGLLKKTSPLFLLPRNHVGITTKRNEFKAKLNGNIEFYQRLFH